MSRFYDDFDIYLNVIIVAAIKACFDRACRKGYWSAIEIADDIRPHIKYIAFYIKQPHGAIMYIAKVRKITSSRKQGKWVVWFDGEVKALKNPITFGGVNVGIVLVES